jgi:hypothetical protein
MEAAQQGGVSLGGHRDPGAARGGIPRYVAGRAIQFTNRKKLVAQQPHLEKGIPPFEEGMECVITIDSRHAATFRFRDQPRAERASFVRHLGPKHLFERVHPIAATSDALDSVGEPLDQVLSRIK